MPTSVMMTENTVSRPLSKRLASKKAINFRELSGIAVRVVSPATTEYVPVYKQAVKQLKKAKDVYAFVDEDFENSYDEVYDKDMDDIMTDILNKENKDRICVLKRRKRCFSTNHNEVQKKVATNISSKSKRIVPKLRPREQIAQKSAGNIAGLDKNGSPIFHPHNSNSAFEHIVHESTTNNSSKLASIVIPNNTNSSVVHLLQESIINSPKPTLDNNTNLVCIPKNLSSTVGITEPISVCQFRQSSSNRLCNIRQFIITPNSKKGETDSKIPIGSTPQRDFCTNFTEPVSYNCSDIIFHGFDKYTDSSNSDRLSAISSNRVSSGTCSNLDFGFEDIEEKCSTPHANNTILQLQAVSRKLSGKSPWRPSLVCKTKRYLSCNDKNLPNVDQEVVLKASAHTDKRSGMKVQSKLPQFLTSARSSANDENDMNMSNMLFDNNTLSPIKSKLKTPEKQRHEMDNSYFGFITPDSKCNSKGISPDNMNSLRKPIRLEMRDMNALRKQYVSKKRKQSIFGDAENVLVSSTETINEYVPDEPVTVALFEELPPGHHQTRTQKRQRQKSQFTDRQPKKLKLTDADQWAKKFNKMCSEIEKHELLFD